MVLERPVRVPVRRKRRWRSPVTLLLLLALLFGATWFGWRALRAVTPSVVSSCTPAGEVLQAADVRVAVLNATGRFGLASRTATSLRARGFDVGTVGNYEDVDVPGIGLVRGRRAASDEIRLVRAQAPGVIVTFDERPDNSVDLVLGDRFTALAPLPTATRAPTC